MAGAFAPDTHECGAVPGGFSQLDRVLGTPDRFAIDFHNHVAWFQPGFTSSRTLFHARDQSALDVGWNLELTSRVLIEIAHRHALQSLRVIGVAGSFSQLV